jgi:hypothetical protein
MSELLQSGQHPDADQLNAFVERALPLHERERMLAHLAECPDCRETVVLSLPQGDELPNVHPLPARKSWISGWNLAWPAAATAALAATTILVIYIHHVSSVRNESTTTSQMAESRRLASPVPAQNAGSPGEMAQSNRAQAVPAKQSADLKSVTKMDEAEKDHAALHGNGMAQLPIKGRNEIQLDKKTDTAPAALVLQPASGALKESTKDASAAVASNEPRAGQNPAAPLSGIAAFGAAGANAITRASSQQAQLALPSGRPVLSMTTHDRLILAIDSQSAVFLSRDAGLHWTSVSTPWKSRAVSATLVSYGAPPALRMGAVRASNESALARDQRKLLGTAGPVLTGTVTDASGAVIPNAAVEILDEGSHPLRTAITDRDGRYRIDGLPSGNYRLEANAPGFTRLDLAAVVVSASGPNVMNLSLQVSSASETVTVASSSIQIDELQSVPQSKAKSEPPKTTIPIFEIVTENGDHWTSADGVTWKPK